jgi:hypothetical protein
MKHKSPAAFNLQVANFSLPVLKKGSFKSPAFLFSALFFFSSLSFSQDKLYKQNGQVLNVKVVEIASSEIKYKLYTNLDGPIYVLETDRIKKLIYENGKTETFSENLMDPDKYTGQANKAIKVNFFSPLYGFFEVGFEKSIKPGRAFEVSLGIIGAGRTSILDFYDSKLGDVKRAPSGFFVSGGFKFDKLPELFASKKTRVSHIMQGNYIKPVFYLGKYSENTVIRKNNRPVVEKQNVTFGALQLEFGRQWVLGNRLVIDLYSGLGYGFDNKKYADQYYSSENEKSDYAYNYANARLGKSPGFSYTFGLKLGMLMGTKK